MLKLAIAIAAAAALSPLVIRSYNELELLAQLIERLIG